jgi:2-methylcitrate dehydratase PrpD
MALGGMDFRTDTRRSTHAFAGTFGAAAAAGSLAQLDERQARWLLDYASQQAAGYAVWGRDTEHVEKAFVFGGMPARAGVTAAEVVRAGWSGVDDVFSGEDNFFRVNSPAAKPERLVEALGQRYEIERTDIKKWTVGTPIQGPLDALENLLRTHRLKAEDVSAVTVRLAPGVGSVVDNRDIPDICLQHMLAVMLVDGTVSFRAAHDAARMQDPAVLRERAKVRYVPDSELTARLPVRVAIVEVTLRDGSRQSERVEAVRGTPRNPMGREEVVAKARDLIAPVLGAKTAARLIDTLLALDTLPEIRELRPLLQRQRKDNA